MLDRKSIECPYWFPTDVPIGSPRAVGEHPLPSYGSVGSVNRPVRLSASGGDPHAGWCGGWGRKTPGYPIIAKEFLPSHNFQQRQMVLNIHFFRLKDTRKDTG